MYGKILCREYKIIETFQWNYALYLAHSRLNHKESAVGFELPTLNWGEGTFWQKLCLFQVNTARHSLEAMSLFCRSAQKRNWEFSELEIRP